MSHYRGTQFFSIALFSLLLLTACNKPPGNFEGIQQNISNAVNVADADVTKNVKIALDGDIAINGFDISVTTRKGDVRLVGVVDTQTQIDAVIKLARGADGAHTINNELTIKN
ncbi:BON domain-containing protein [Marinobacter sp. ELB17]|uniref:BON domain-containing protein n=1 Tax=Marinobacter sp. ELB17 TaxID=270374 RepID=UPI0000F37B41|nr:BON domain-containing protein [Marinobacter sp. ELB17]EAZ97832.1 Transport-associated protein [Marinobacter sp. ELB17]